MLKVWITTLALLPILYFSGLIINSIFKIKNTILALLLGFSFVLYMASLVAISVIKIEIFFSIIIVLTVAGIFFSFYKFKVPGIKNCRGAILAFIVGHFLFTYFQFTNLIEQGLRLRTGPDIMGWLASSNYFRDHDSLDYLKDSIARQFKVMADPSFYSLLSFREQVQGEFLIGADRFGLSSFIGFTSRLFPFSTTVVLLAFMGIFGGIIGVFLHNLCEQYKLKNITKIILFMSVFGNTAVMNPIFEGGIWVVFILPIILILITKLTSTINYPDSVSIILLSVLLTFSATLNSDVLPISVLFISIYILNFVKLRKFRHIGYLLITPILLFPFKDNVLGGTSQRLSDVNQSGWRTIDFITPIDLFGISPFTPANSVADSGVASNVKLSVLIISVLLSLLLVYQFKDFFNSQQFISRTYIYFLVIIFLLLNFLSFFEMLNYYFAWKISFLFAIMLPSLIIHISTSNNYIVKSKQHFFNFSAYSRTISKNLLIIILIYSSVLLPINWYNHSNKGLIPTSIDFNSASHQRLNQIFEKYVIEAQCGPWWQSIILLSDLKIESASRNIQKPIDTYSLEKLFLIDVNYPYCAEIVSNLSNEKVKYKVENLVFISK